MAVQRNMYQYAPAKYNASTEDRTRSGELYARYQQQEIDFRMEEL